MTSVSAVALLAFALTLTSCGGSDAGQKTVASIGQTKVDQATLNHWMGVVLGGDYAAALGKRAPDGLVSDPANYASCVSAAQTIVPKLGGKPKLTNAQLGVKCRQLNTAIREQALNYVLSVLWVREEGVRLGIKLPDEGEISSHLRDLIYDQFKNPAYFRSEIAKQRRSLADVRFLIKRNIIEIKIFKRLEAVAAKLGGGQRTAYKLDLQNNARWHAKTNCSPGYSAWECKQYVREASPSAAVLLERLGKGVA